MIAVPESGLISPVVVVLSPFLLALFDAVSDEANKKN